jgi:hypothetical protein
MSLDNNFQPNEIIETHIEDVRIDNFEELKEIDGMKIS